MEDLESIKFISNESASISSSIRSLMTEAAKPGGPFSELYTLATPRPDGGTMIEAIRAIINGNTDLREAFETPKIKNNLVTLYDICFNARCLPDWVIQGIIKGHLTRIASDTEYYDKIYEYLNVNREYIVLLIMEPYLDIKYTA